MSWVLDLDGVVWRGSVAIDGAARAIARIQTARQRVVYATNNAWLTSEGFVKKLADMNIAAQPADIVHGGHAVASLVKPGERVLLCSGHGVAEALDGVAEVIDVADLEDDTPPKVDVVSMGIRPGYRYEWLNYATQAVLAGARLIAPSADPLYPVPHGFLLGGGAAVAAIEYATGVTAETAGKPFTPIADVVRLRVGTDDVQVVVGDQARTDGRLAQHLNVPFALVATGVTQKGGRSGEDTPDVPVDFVARDLSHVVDHYLGTVIS